MVSTGGSLYAHPPVYPLVTRMSATTGEVLAPPLATQGTDLGLLSRLSGMMFLQYMSVGLWSVTVGTFIASNTGTAGSGVFTSGFAGISGITAGLGALVAPLLFGTLADSWIRAERLMALLNLGCAVMLCAMWNSTNQWWFLVAMIGYYQCCCPTLALGNSMVMRHLRDSKHLYPVVRSVGTVGWVFSGLLLGVLIPSLWHYPAPLVERSTWPMALACGGHLTMAIYSLWLPATPPLGGVLGWRTMLTGLQTLIQQQPRLLAFLAVCFFAAIPAQFYGFSNLFLNQQGFERAVTVNSLAQVSEIVGSICLPWMLLRWGPKRLFVVGVIVWGVRYVCLAFGGTAGLALVATYAGVLAHGVCFPMVYLTAAMYVGYAAAPQNQSAAQGLLTMVMGGVAVLTGSGMMGYLQSQLLTPAGVAEAPYHWTPFFLIPAAMTVVVLVLFWRLMGFHREVMPGELRGAGGVAD